MPDFTGGYTAAVDSESNRRFRQAQIQNWLAEMALMQQQQRNREEDRQRRLTAEHNAGATFDKMFLGGADAGPTAQPPMPGQASTPMLPPGVEPGGLPGATQPPPLPPPQAGPPPGPPMPQVAPNLPPGGITGIVQDPRAAMAAAQAADRAGQKVDIRQPPPGFKLSPAAPPALGGGATPQAGNAPPGGDVPLPPPASIPGLQPGQAFSVKDAIKAMQKAGVKSDQIIPTLDAMLPAINAQNREQLEAFRMETQATKAALEAYRAFYDAQNKGSLIKSREERSTREDAKLRILEAKQDSVAGKNISEDTLAMMADQYLAGDKSVAQGLGYGNVGAGNRAALREAIAKKAKAAGMSGADIAAQLIEYQGLAQSERTVGQRSAQVQLASSEANKMADILIDKSSGFSRTQFQPINKVLALVEKGGGGTAVREYAASINSFINAYARAIAPTGVATVSDKDHAREILSLADSQEQLEAIVAVLKREMGAAMAAPREVRGQLRGEVTDRGDRGGAQRAGALPPTNAKGWKLMRDAQGNQAYVSPDGKQFEEPK